MCLDEAILQTSTSKPHTQCAHIIRYAYKSMFSYNFSENLIILSHILKSHEK
jgi:hypothetical protein